MATDIKIMVTMFFIFIGLGVLMPFVNDAFLIQSSEVNVEGFGEEITGGSVISLSIILSIGKMFLWTFGDLPLLIDLLILLPMRITFIWLIVRTIRGVG